MANGASRLFKIMQNAGTDTVSEVVSLTVKSLNPLVFNLDNRIDLTSEFYTLSNDVDRNRLRVGTKVVATTFNGGQNYFISQGSIDDINKSATLQEEINALEARVTVIEATLVSHQNQINAINTEINSIKSTLDSINGSLDTVNSSLSTINNTLSTLDSRLTTVEGKV